LFAFFLLVSGAFGIVFVTSVSIIIANISTSWRRASIYCSGMGANGTAGCGLTRASIRCAAVSLAASADEVFGMLYRYGENSIVRAMSSDLVLVT